MTKVAPLAPRRKRKKNMKTSSSPLSRLLRRTDGEEGSGSSWLKPNGDFPTGGAPAATALTAIAGWPTAMPCAGLAACATGTGALATCADVFALAWKACLQCLQRIALSTHSDGIRSTFWQCGHLA